MGFTVKVNTVTVGVNIGAQLTQALNSRDSFRCTVTSADGSVRPQQDDDLTVREDGEGSDIFGGLIDRPTLSGFMGDSQTPVDTKVVANDYKSFAARRVINTFIPSGNVLAAVNAIQPYLAPYGITVDAAQVAGPTLPDLDFRDYLYIDGCLDNICTLAGTDWAWVISPAKKLKVFQLGLDAAPFAIADGDGNVCGDLEAEPNRQNYANHIIVRFNSAAMAAYAFLGVSSNFSDGDTVVIGSTTYTFQTVLTDANGHVLIGATKEDSLGNLVAAINLAGGAGSSYAASTTLNTAVQAYLRDVDNMVAKATTAGASGNSIGISTTSAGAIWYGEGAIPLSTLELGADQELTSTVDYPTTLPAQPWDLVVQSDTTDIATARALAQAIYDVRSQTPRTVRYPTYQTGLRPGQLQSINSAIRFVNTQFTITEITATEQADGRVLRRVTAIEGNTFKGTWRDVYKLWAGKTNATTAVAVSTATSGGSTAGRKVYFLGGDGVQYVRSATPTWVPVAGPLDVGLNRGGAVEVIIDTAVWGSTTGIVTVRLKARSGSVQARLRNLDDGTTAGTSSVVSSPNFTTVVFGVTLTTGSRTYRLELLPGTANVDVAGVGYLE